MKVKELIDLLKEYKDYDIRITVSDTRDEIWYWLDTFDIKWILDVWYSSKIIKIDVEKL